MKKTMKKMMVLTLLVPLFVLGHGTEEHTEAKQEIIVKSELEKDKNKEVFNSINQAYVESTKEIFKIKCFDCHAKITVFPWYYKIPGIKQLMDYDMKEAKKHLDMSKDFPFISHESPVKDLKSLKEVIEEGEMPPIQYVLGHWDSRLTEDEKKEVLEWIDTSLKILGETK